MFKNGSSAYKLMASKQELLDSIRPDMMLTRAFFRRIYGYGVTDPDFVDVALHKLKEAGYSKAVMYYLNVEVEEDRKQEEMYRSVAEWYRKRDFNKKKEVRKSRNELKKMSNSELLTYLENLIEEE